MRLQLPRIARPRPFFWWILAADVTVSLTLAAFFLPGGEDLYRYYLPFVNGCLNCGFVPYYAQWILAPLRLLPYYPYAWPVWTFVSLAGAMVLAYFTKVNPFLFLISFAMFGQIWLGQIDLVVCLGLVLLLMANNSFARGFGITLAMIKPQLALLPIILLIFLDLRRLSWKLFVIPVGVFLASLVVYGARWPLVWSTNTLASLPAHSWRLAGADTWRFGLFMIPTVFLFRDSRSRLEAGLLVSSLATPFFGAYSYITFLLFRMKWWYLPLSFAWALAFPWLGESAMRFAWILPLAMFIDLAYEKWPFWASRKAAESDLSTGP